jgi:hypothetical protein
MTSDISPESPAGVEPVWVQTTGSDGGMNTAAR